MIIESQSIYNTECPKMYRKSVLHLLKRTWNMRVSRAVQIFGNIWNAPVHNLSMIIRDTDCLPESLEGIVWVHQWVYNIVHDHKPASWGSVLGEAVPSVHKYGQVVIPSKGKYFQIFLKIFSYLGILYAWITASVMLI